MAYTPYIRYRTNSLSLDGISGPVFPFQQGMTAHTYQTEKRKYTNTSRYHATTDVGWKTDGIQKTVRDTIWAFWDTTLGKGYSDVTLIDNRSRMLFEGSWPAWGERWRKERGGIYEIEYGIEAPVPWTPPVWGCWPSTTNDLVNHNLSGDDLTVGDGAMTLHDDDSDILRENGYGLKLTGAGATETGASGSVSWRSGNQYGSVTLFCQARVAEVNSVLKLLEITDGTNIFRIEMNADSGTNQLRGYIYNDGASYVTKADTNYLETTINTWYDIALTFDDVNNDVHLYYALSPATDANFTNFLYGLTDIEDGVISTLSAAKYPARARWTTVNLLAETAADTLTNGEIAYLQNAFVIDDFITPVEFNTLRRLCHLWNSKTTGTWPA